MTSKFKNIHCDCDVCRELRKDTMIAELTATISRQQAEIDRLTSAIQSAQKETAREICKHVESMPFMANDIIAAIKSRYGVE